MSETWRIIHYVWTYGGDLALVLCAAAAWRWGGRAEKWAAAILTSGWLLTFLVARLNLESIYGHHPLVMAIDAGVLAAFVRLSLWSRRPSTLLLAASQLNDILTYPAAYVSRMDIFTFVTALEFWGGWALILILAWGVWDHDRGGEAA